MNAFLCLCVVSIHLTSTPLTELRMDSFWYAVIFGINKLLHFSVPAFIFLSGFKLYSKYGGSRIDLKSFFKGRFFKIVVPYLVCVFIYFIYFLNKGWVSIENLPKYIFLGTLAAHFYYIVIAVQLYLIFPLLKRVFEKYPRLMLTATLGVTVCCLEVFHFKYQDRFFGLYIFYFALGMAFSKYRLWEKMERLYVPCVFGFILTAVVHISFSYLEVTGKTLYRAANIINIVYVIFAIGAIYAFCMKIAKSCNFTYRCAKALGDVSYSIYLYHILAIFILKYDILPKYALSVKWRFVISSVVLYSLIFLYAFLREKVKKSEIFALHKRVSKT